MNPAILSPHLVRDFVIAAHGDLNKVKSMLAEHPDLLNAAHPWSENDFETLLAAAAHVGNHPVAEFLLEQGAPLDICVAAMLNHVEDVARFLKADPGLVDAASAHHIPLMFHVAMGGSTEIAQQVLDHGGTQGMVAALHIAVARGDIAMVSWLLSGQLTDPNVVDPQGKTPLAVALEDGHTELTDLLREHGASPQAP